MLFTLRWDVALISHSSQSDEQVECNSRQGCTRLLSSHSTLEATQEQILNQSTADATSGRWQLNGSSLKKPYIYLWVVSRVAFRENPRDFDVPSPIYNFMLLKCSRSRSLELRVNRAHNLSMLTRHKAHNLYPNPWEAHSRSCLIMASVGVHTWRPRWYQ